MIKKKVCLIGSFGVGKTSLVSRFVSGIFSEKYLTTVGVKIDSKELEIGEVIVRIVVWDLAGEDDFQHLRVSYLKGASGCVFVADGTRCETIRQSENHISRAAELLPSIQGRVLLINKSDLTDSWDPDEEALHRLEGDIRVLPTSAKTGHNVEEAFRWLAETMIQTGNSQTEPFL